MSSLKAPPKKVLTIGGSDSGGAAGIQADLKTITTLGCYGMTTLTVVTAQNSCMVQDIHFLPSSFVQSQIQTILSDYNAHAIKTGFIGQVSLIETIAHTLQDYKKPIIVDPVLVNGKGQTMFALDVAEAYQQHLFPLATLLTPNWQEATLLTHINIHDLSSAQQAIQKLYNKAHCPILITGISQADTTLDLFYDGQQEKPFLIPTIQTNNTHGSGDTLSAGITTFLAQGYPLLEAIQHAQQFTHAAILAAANWHLGKGHGPLAQWLAPHPASPAT